MAYNLVNGRVVRDDGYVALENYNSNPATIRMDADGTEYRFVPKLSISMAWVKSEHVNSLLQVLAKVCCNKKVNKFHTSSLINVNLWETGAREGTGE